MTGCLTHRSPGTLDDQVSEPKGEVFIDRSPQEQHMEVHGRHQRFKDETAVGPDTVTPLATAGGPLEHDTSGVHPRLEELITTRGRRRIIIGYDQGFGESTAQRSAQIGGDRACEGGQVAAEAAGIRDGDQFLTVVQESIEQQPLPRTPPPVDRRLMHPRPTRYLAHADALGAILSRQFQGRAQDRFADRGRPATGTLPHFMLCHKHTLTRVSCDSRLRGHTRLLGVSR